MARRGWRRERAMDLNTGVCSSAGRRHTGDKRTVPVSLAWTLGSVYLLTRPLAQGQAWPAPRGSWAVAAWGAEQAALLLPGPASVELGFRHGQRDFGCPNVSKAQPHPCVDVFKLTLNFFAISSSDQRGLRAQHVAWPSPVYHKGRLSRTLP